MTKSEKELIDNLRALWTDPGPPEEWVSLSVEKEVLSKRVRTAPNPELRTPNSAEPTAYIDQ